MFSHGGGGWEGATSFQLATCAGSTGPAWPLGPTLGMCPRGAPSTLGHSRSAGPPACLNLCSSPPQLSWGRSCLSSFSGPREQWRSRKQAVGFLQAPGVDRGCGELCNRPEHRAGAQGCGAPRWWSASCAPHSLPRDRGERRWRVQGGCSPLPSRQQLPSALCTKPPWTNGPDVCSASTFWAGALLRDGIPREAAVPAAEPGRSAGGDAAAQQPLDEGRPMWEITQKAAAEHRERHPPHLRETSKVGRKGSRPGGSARHQQDEINLEGGHQRVSLQGDHTEARRFC